MASTKTTAAVLAALPFFTRFNHGTHVMKEPGESLTKQSFKDEVNVNTIVNKYRKTRDLSLLEAKKAFYADFSEHVDLAGAYKAIDSAEKQFMELSSNAREYFDNDPVKFFETFKDPDKVAKLPENLGLLKKKAEAVTAPAATVSPTETVAPATAKGGETPST